jgi:hypothetical protein
MLVLMENVFFKINLQPLLSLAILLFALGEMAQIA